MKHAAEIIRAAFITLALGLLALLPRVADAKTVAVLFDTSGSMEPRFQLPSFGARMLAATIDGRAGFDRLLVMNFNEYFTRWNSTIPDIDASMASGPAPDIDQIVAGLPNAIADLSVTSGRDHKSLMARLERTFQYVGSTSTPYGPIEVMLERLVQDATPGEEAVFILVTDGGYDLGDLFANGALVPHMRARFEAVQERLTAKGATLSVQYLFIDQQGGSELRQTVREQGVRDTLLEVFNGDAREGSKYVSSAEELWEALQDIIAEVSDKDRDAQADFIDYSGNTISLSTPLSISRVVIVSTGQRGAVPERQSDTFSEAPTETRKVSTQMSGTDAAFGNPPRRGGIVEHLYFQRAVPPGNYELMFSGPVTDDVFLLFETRAKNALQLFDSAGTEVLPDATGQLHVYIRQDYTFRSTILDGDAAPQPQPVDFAKLPHNLSIALTLADDRSPTTSTMALDDTTDIASAPWTPGREGEMTAVSRASAGVLSPRSETLRILVLDSTAAVTVSPITPTVTCTTCAPDEIELPLTAQPGSSVGTFEITAEADLDGEVTLEGTELPPGTEIRDENGNPIDLTTPLPFQANSTRIFTLWRTDDATVEDIAEGGTDVTIVATPTGQWGGSPAQVVTRAKIEAPEMSMTLVDVTQPITPGQVDGLLVPAGELVRGQFAAQYALVDLLLPPDNSVIDDLVSIEASGWMSGLVRLTPNFPNPASTGFNALEIRPKTRFWCLCWIWGANTVRGTDMRDITVSYQLRASGVVLQQASVTTRVAYPVPFVPQGSLSCALNLLYLALTWILLRGVWAVFTTHRFPSRSVVEITRGNSAPSFRRLDKGNSVWWKAWFATFIGNPDEVRVIEGVRLRATHKGAIVDVSKATPPWRLERLDASFEELKQNQPKKTEHRLMWGERLDSLFDPTLSMRLKKKSGD